VTSHRSTQTSLSSTGSTSISPKSGRPPVAGGSVLDRLVGAWLPSVVLSGGWEPEMNIGEFVHEHLVVVYVYPGCGSDTEDTGDPDGIPQADAVQHRVFRDRGADFEAHESRVLGISSQSKQAQRQAARANRVSHTLLCDSELKLAAELGLPTFTRHDAYWYERITLVVRRGRIVKAFFPVVSAARSAAQVIAWLTVHEGLPRVDDAS
jgi:peroxiredoxin